MKNARGFTLLELAISMGIMLVAIVATCVMLIEGQRFTRNTEEVSQSNDSSRMAGEFIVSALRIAGMGAAMGVWINNAGTPRLISPIFGTDNISTANNTDDIWMVIPDRRAFQESNCQSGSGGAASLTRGGVGQLKVTCTRSLFPATGPSPSLLLVTNFANPGVLITRPTVVIASDGTNEGAIDYNESTLPSFPPRAFLSGDIVYGATVAHFFIARDANGRSGLYREQGTLSGNSPPSFVAGTTSRMLLQNDIEDLQITYGVDPNNSGLPSNYVFSNGFPDALGPVSLRGVRVSVVSTHQRRMSKADGTGVTIYQPVSVENHPSSGVLDAFRRSLYTRRIETQNLSPGNL
jgi:type II secretory pathway pseudopilin PulG